MKSKMTVPYRNRFWVVLGCLLMLAFTGPLMVTFIREEELGGAVICAFFVLVLLHGAWQRLHYGLRISEKRVVLRSQRQRHVVCPMTPWLRWWSPLPKTRFWRA